MVKLKGIDGGKLARLVKLAGLSLHPDDYEGQIPASEFITPSTDSKGHSGKLETRVPPSLVHELDVHLASRVYPWRTRSEAVRWFVYRGLAALADMSRNKEVSNVRAQTAAIVSAARLQLDLLDFETTVVQVSRVLKRLRQEGDRPAARKLMREIEERVAGMDDEYWRRKYEVVLRDKLREDWIWTSKN